MAATPLIEPGHKTQQKQIGNSNPTPGCKVLLTVEAPRWTFHSLKGAAVFPWITCIFTSNYFIYRMGFNKSHPLSLRTRKQEPQRVSANTQAPLHKRKVCHPPCCASCSIFLSLRNCNSLQWLAERAQIQNIHIVSLLTDISVPCIIEKMLAIYFEVHPFKGNQELKIQFNWRETEPKQTLHKWTKANKKEEACAKS